MVHINIEDELKEMHTISLQSRRYAYKDPFATMETFRCCVPVFANCHQQHLRFSTTMKFRKVFDEYLTWHSQQWSRGPFLICELSPATTLFPQHVYKYLVHMPRWLRAKVLHCHNAPIRCSYVAAQEEHWCGTTST